jgi:hypothetical protein
MANAFSGSRQAMFSPYSQIGVDPFGYSPGGTFMGGGMGGFGGGFGMPSYGMPSYGGGFGMGGMPSFTNPFSGGGFGFGSGIGGFGGGGGYGTSFGGMNMGGGSQGYQFPVPPQPSVNDLFGQYMMNQYYGGGAFNPYQTPGFGYGGGGGFFGGGGRMQPQPMPSYGDDTMTIGGGGGIDLWNQNPLPPEPAAGLQALGMPGGGQWPQTGGGNAPPPGMMLNPNYSPSRSMLDNVPIRGSADELLRQMYIPATGGGKPAPDMGGQVIPPMQPFPQSTSQDMINERLRGIRSRFV